MADFAADREPAGSDMPTACRPATVRRARHGQWRRLPACLLLVLALSGCASYVGSFDAMDHALARRDVPAALDALQPLAESDHNRALYLLDKAMLLRIQHDYAGSIKAFKAVKVLLRHLEATSISENVAALTVTENLRSYVPPLYERLLIYVYQSLNYLQSGDIQAARVESRQIDVLLKRLYPNTDAAPDGVAAFARYFAGLVYEDTHAYDDAMIAYRKADAAYRKAGQTVPPALRISLCRLADYLGLTSELARYQQRFRLHHWPPVDTNKGPAQGQLVVLVNNGRAPARVAKTQALQDYHNGHLFSISLPVLQRRKPPARNVTLQIGPHRVRTQPVDDIAAHAQRVLEQQRGRLIASELARNITRGAIANQADKVNPLLGVLVTLTGAVTDRADTRTWGTLPDTIQMARLWLAPGTYNMVVSRRGRSSGEHAFSDVQIRPGRITFITWSTIGP